MSSSSSPAPPHGTARWTAVPSTQNTAPVAKFRCLYTYDLRRKAKRWHDGFLRFHTFNRRIMVYDTPGNYIGDHHWRQDGGIQDGDELELDKGVLVQVCECMEKTQTDISVLFEKKKSSQGSPQMKNPLTQARPTPTTTPMRPTLARSSQTPRPLYDLLGIKKTPIGRAITPKSPYEQRYPPTRSVDKGQNSERAPKRQRALPPEKGMRERGLNAAYPISIDISDSFTHSRSKEIPKPKPALGTPEESRKTSDTREIMPDTTVHKDRLSKDIQQPKVPLSDNSTRQSSFQSTPIRLPEEPVNTLRISNEKPRRKLMYRALLPTKGQGSSSSLTTTTTKTNNMTNKPMDSESVRTQ